MAAILRSIALNHKTVAVASIVPQPLRRNQALGCSKKCEQTVQLSIGGCLLLDSFGAIDNGQPTAHLLFKADDSSPDCLRSLAEASP